MTADNQIALTPIANRQYLGMIPLVRYRPSRVWKTIEGAAPLVKGGELALATMS